MKEASYIRMLERPTDPHLLQIIGELFPAIEADDVRPPVWNARLTRGSDRSTHAPVRTSEEEVQDCLDHLDLRAWELICFPYCGKRQREMFK